MNRCLFLASTIAGILFAGPASASEILCLFNEYSGNVYGGRGASFRSRICNSEGNCDGWTSWDWLQQGRSRTYEYPNRGHIEVQWNADGDNDIRTKVLTVFYTPRNRQCGDVNSWSFDDASDTHLIWLFPGK